MQNEAGLLAPSVDLFVKGQDKDEVDERSEKPHNALVQVGKTID